MINSPIETNQIQAHYDKLSQFYRTFWGDQIHHGYWHDISSPASAQIRLIEELASFAKLKRGGRILDVGCGVGGSSIWLAEHLGSWVQALTISPVQVNIALKLAHVAGLADRISFCVHDANRLDEISGGFDSVWAIESTEHLHDKHAFVNSAARCLNGGGTLALCAWLVPDGFASSEHEHLARAVCMGMLCPSLVSAREYQEWMIDAGFHDVRFREITRQVEHTWERCSQIANRREVQTVLRFADEQTRRFVDCFDVMRRAYQEGALQYGMFACTK